MLVTFKIKTIQHIVELIISAFKDKCIFVCYNNDNNLLFYLQLANHSFELQNWKEVQCMFTY